MRGLCVLGEVINEQKDEDRSEDQTLGDATGDWHSLGFLTINYNFLQMASQEELDLVSSLERNASIVKHVQEVIMQDFVKSLTEVHHDSVALFPVLYGLQNIGGKLNQFGLA